MSKYGFLKTGGSGLQLYGHSIFLIQQVVFEIELKVINESTKQFHIRASVISCSWCSISLKVSHSYNSRSYLVSWYYLILLCLCVNDLTGICNTEHLWTNIYYSFISVGMKHILAKWEVGTSTEHSSLMFIHRLVKC